MPIDSILEIQIQLREEPLPFYVFTTSIYSYSATLNYWPKANVQQGSIDSSAYCDVVEGLRQLLTHNSLNDASEVYSAIVAVAVVAERERFVEMKNYLTKQPPPRRQRLSRARP